MIIKNEVNHPPSEIQQFYSGKTVFLTGGSGFLGRLLVEKLLRTCTDIKHIYILLREKKGKLPSDRFKDVFNVPAFDLLRTEQPDFLSKVSIIEGDLELPFLGLSETSRQIIIDEVDCIFSIGATVRFDENLRKGAYINVRSTRDLLRIAKNMKHLKSFIHASTAFSNCTRQNIDELFYEPIMTGDKLLNLVECLDDQVLERIKSTIIRDNPNTYIFTKAIAEDVVNREAEDLPVAVVRPSIVISTYLEPIPGWIDNLYGPTTLLVGTALGLIRTLYGDGRNIADIVPADFVVNSMLIASWDVAQNKSNGASEDGVVKPKIYNYVSSPQNPVTWNEYKDYSKEEALKIPSPLIIWHSTFNLHSNYYQHLLIAFLFQTIPAYVIDFFAKCLGRQPQFVHAVTKINKFCAVISYFSLRQWNFKNNNLQELWKGLNSTDQKLYNFDISSMSWQDYFQNYPLGARLYILKDSLDTIPQGRRKLLAVKVGHYILVTVLCLLILKILSIMWHLF